MAWGSALGLVFGLAPELRGDLRRDCAGTAPGLAWGLALELAPGLRRDQSPACAPGLRGSCAGPHVHRELRVRRELAPGLAPRRMFRIKVAPGICAEKLRRPRCVCAGAGEGR